MTKLGRAFLAVMADTERRRPATCSALIGIFSSGLLRGPVRNAMQASGGDVLQRIRDGAPVATGSGTSRRRRRGASSFNIPRGDASCAPAGVRPRCDAGRGLTASVLVAAGTPAETEGRFAAAP